MWRLAPLVLFAFAACESETFPGDNGDAGTGDGGMGDDSSNSDADVPQCGVLRAVIRDFRIDHPDFEVTPAENVVVPGLVATTITPGGKPALSAAPPAAGLITDSTTFAEWYTDVAGVNQRFDRDIPLAMEGANYVYDDQEYFPIDDEGFGNETNANNFHFTTELHAQFTYQGGESFTFRGDDDVWVYVNGRLAIDIGGVHSAMEASVDFDLRASELDITVGNTYAIDFFQAERHITGSSFRLETTIDCFVVQ